MKRIAVAVLVAGALALGVLWCESAANADVMQQEKLKHPSKKPPQGSYSTQLGWVAPTTRTDGSPIALSEIAGYRLKWGSTPGAYSGEAIVADAATTRYTVTGLTSGSWYFVVSAVDTGGLQGPESPVLTRAVP